MIYLHAYFYVSTREMYKAMLQGRLLYYTTPSSCYQTMALMW